MGQRENDRRAVLAGAAVAGLMAFFHMYTTRTALLLGACAVAAGVVAGALCGVWEYSGSEGMTAAIVGSIVGIVLGHPSLLGPTNVAAVFQQSSRTAMKIGDARLYSVFLAFPILGFLGFATARVTTLTRRRFSST